MSKGNKHIKLLAYACSALVLAGCQTTGGTNGLVSQAQDGTERTQTAQKRGSSERSYSFFSDQGAHLKDI